MGAARLEVRLAAHLAALPVALWALASALPLQAETPAAPRPDATLTAEGFDALTRGRTMDTYDAVSGLYGVETFLPGRQVIWRDAEKCVRGTWEEVAGQICFTYEANDNNPVCWVYVDRGGWIEGWFQGNRSLTPIELHEGSTPVACDGWLGS